MVCDWCGSIVFGDYWVSDGVYGQFCSQSCADAARLDQVGSKCRWCGKKYDVAEIRASGLPIWRGFCSEACKIDYDNAHPQVEPPAPSDGIVTCSLDSLSSLEATCGDPTDRHVPEGTRCRFGDNSNITWTNVGWTFNKNTVTVSYDSIVNNSPWETGSLRVGVFTSPQKGTFNFNDYPSGGHEHNDWKKQMCFLWGSPVFAGLKQGNHYTKGSVNIEIPKEIFKRVPKSVYIAVAIQEAGAWLINSAYYEGNWSSRSASTANNPGFVNCIQTKSLFGTGIQNAPLVKAGLKLISQSEEEFCYCTECGAKNKKSNTFCEECGEKLEN